LDNAGGSRPTGIYIIGRGRYNIGLYRVGKRRVVGNVKKKSEAPDRLGGINKKVNGPHLGWEGN